MDGQGAAAVRVLGIVQIAAQLVGLHGAEVSLVAVFHLDAGQALVLPADDNFLGARLIARFGAGMGKLRHGHRAADDEVLTGTDIHAHLDDEISIELQIFLVHCIFLLFSARGAGSVFGFHCHSVYTMPGKKKRYA